MELSTKKKLTEMTRDEKTIWFRQFLAEKNKNKRKPTQEEVTAEFESLRGKYYVDTNGNFRFIDGSDK